jgi:riboflavin biosynthesis pyrimidine reductase
VKIVDTEGEKKRQVKAVKLRRLPYVSGTPTAIHDNDRLDVMAERRYKDATMFWHIADANTELEANRLIEEKSERVSIIIVPES